LKKIFTYVKTGKKIDKIKYKQYLNGIPHSIWTGRRNLLFIIKNKIELNYNKINFDNINQFIQKLINPKYKKSSNFDTLLKQAMIHHNSTIMYKLTKLNKHILSL
jgi:hypothetical protein